MKHSYKIEINSKLANKKTKKNYISFCFSQPERLGKHFLASSFVSSLGNLQLFVVLVFGTPLQEATEEGEDRFRGGHCFDSSGVLRDLQDFSSFRFRFCVGDFFLWDEWVYYYYGCFLL